MEPKPLGAMQRNALCQFFGRKEFSPEEVAELGYADVERLPKIGKKGIDAIRAWLQGHGYDLREVPAAGHGRCTQEKLQQRLQLAARLLQKYGYRVESPK